jgi:hypothetical protein
MGVQILMKRLRIVRIPKERIKPVESTDSRVIVSLPQILLSDFRIELFSAVQKFRQSIGGIKPNGITVGIEGVELGGGSCEVKQRTGRTVSVERKVIFMFRAAFDDDLRDTLMTDNVGYDRLFARIQIGFCLF